MPIRVHLFDGAGEDRAVELEDHPLSEVSTGEILWVDVQAPDDADLQRLGAAYAWLPETMADLARTHGRARIRLYPAYVHLTIESVVCGEELAIEEIDLLVGRDFVVTVHAADVPALSNLGDEHRGDSQLGTLSAAQFMAVLVDRVLTDYLACVEAVEREVDRLDELALRAREGEVLRSIVRLRRRIAILRRALAPHGAAFAPLPRPDFELHDELGKPWPGLVDRLRQTMAAIENARQLLLGSFDVAMARTAQRSNRAVQVLTVVSAMFLPAAVLAGVLGMNFDLALFDVPGAFYVVVGVMVGTALTIFTVARVKRWI